MLEALIAAGFLTATEAGEAPSAPPDLRSLDDDDVAKGAGVDGPSVEPVDVPDEYCVDVASFDGVQECGAE